jgi:hypothetical protein
VSKEGPGELGGGDEISLRSSTFRNAISSVNGVLK